MHFHILSCKSEARFRPPTCDFQLFSFAYKTNAGSINTTLGGPHRHRKPSVGTCFITSSAFLEISHLDASQGGSTEAPSLSFMPCAKADNNHMELLVMLPNVLLRGMQNTEITEVTQEFKAFLASSIFTYRVASRRLDFNLQLAMFNFPVVPIKPLRNQ